MADHTKPTNLADLTAGNRVEVEIEGKAITLCNVDGTVYALDNTCAHVGGPLGQGELKDDVITCPWHAWEYDVKTGACLSRSNIKLATYPVQIEKDGTINVAV